MYSRISRPPRGICEGTDGGRISEGSLYSLKWHRNSDNYLIGL